MARILILDIENYDGKYKIQSDGKVYSLKRDRLPIYINTSVINVSNVGVGAVLGLMNTPLTRNMHY